MWWSVQERRLGIWLVLLVLFQFPGQSAAADNSDNDGRNWLEETLHRFFGNKALTGENLEGEGLELVSSYVRHAGKTIEVVIVRQVKNFEEGWDGERIYAERLLNNLSRPFQDYTRESIIRQYLLFKSGDTLIPFDLADSERMLRDLSYINDVRIHVVPIHGETDMVGIVVETNDRWPLGITATVITKDRWRAKLFSTNLGGTGLFFSNEVLRNRESEKGWGYRGNLAKENIGGSFWGATAEYEDSYRKQNLQLGVNRALIHPGLNLIGGAQWQDLDDFENEGNPRGFHQTDGWAGEVIRLYDHRSAGSGARSLLVPAIRVLDRDFYHRPTVLPDSNRGYHDSTKYMASLTWQRFKSYKTSFLFGEGEVEDLPTGVAMKLTTVFEDREFENRPGLFFDSAVVSMRNRGDVAFLGFSLGGFLKEGQFDDGILNVSSAYFTPLLGGGAIRHRVIFSLDYALGIGRHPDDRIYLGDRTGIYQLDNGKVAGNNRLVARGFYRMFTPWALWGFRMSIFSFADMGVIGDENASLFKEKIYLSAGLGVRLRNPNLVLPTVQLRVALVSNVENQGFSFGVKVGNVPGPDIRFPGNKPGTLAYE